MFCPKCGHEVEDSARFCGSCGASLEGVTHSVQEKPAPEPEEAPVPEEPVAGEPAPAEQVAAAAVLAATTVEDSRKPGLPSFAKILIPVACAVVAGIIAVFAIGPGGSGTVRVAEGSATPTIVASDGTEISALVRPTFVKLSPTAGGEDADDGGAAAPAQEPAVNPSVASYAVAPDLSNVVNIADFYLDESIPQLLAANGFAVEAGTGSDEFYEAYEMNRYDMTPSFVTVDSMMHTYHLYFQHLLKTIEKGELSSRLSKVSASMLSASEKQLNDLKGTEWESAAMRNTAFFAVGATLIDPSTKVPAPVADTVKQELDLINQQSGLALSPTTGRMVDYTQFIVRGYYEGDEQLERYFRAMMWYGTVNFTQTVSDTQNDSGIAADDLDRSALLMTLALADGPRDDWEAIYTTTSFFAGASDDCGFYEYYPILTSVYGEGVGTASLPGDDAAWQRYHALTEQMPAPAINSVPVWDDGADHKEAEKGFRFMGQRFSIDASIMSKLVYDEVGANASGANRMMPNALDVPAALGSDEALAILDDLEETSYAGYADNMKKLRESLSEDAAPNLWGASLASQWLYTLNPLLAEKGEGWPTVMQSSAWARKSLQSYLGSYTELKHDTVLYAKQVMVEMGGGMIPEKDDRGYVEPEPIVYRRLANLTAATREGLAEFGLISDKDASDLALLQDLAEQLATISDKELAEEALTAEEYDLIREYGGNLEHFWQRVHEDEEDDGYFNAREYPAALVTDIATDADSGEVLELGTGKVSPIYVVVPIDGELHLTEGAVFSFYQFRQPMSERLTDSAWREAVASGGVSGIEDWTRDFQYEWTPSW